LDSGDVGGALSDPAGPITVAPHALPLRPHEADATVRVDHELVFDVGMYLGEDTAFYLRRGFRVVGVEANPSHIAHLEERFSAELRSGRVTILPVAVGRQKGTARFASVEGMTGWGTIDPAYMDRATMHNLGLRMMEVPMVTIDEIMHEHGVPHYMKVDVEGMDMDCMSALAQVPDRPMFVSVETVATGPHSSLSSVLEELRLLRRLGYRRFKLVDQTSLPRLDGTVLQQEGPPMTYEYETYASGPFGEESPGRWHTYRAMLPTSIALMALHNLVGFDGWVAGTKIGGKVRRKLAAGVKAVAPNGPIHGRWFDLHAGL
jgi:FkbM family methyltransferase